MDTTSKVNIRLMESGVKPSLACMAILTYLMEHFTHPTANAIFNDLQPAMPALSQKTVCSTLKLLEKQGAIKTINTGDKNLHYDANISRHAHFQCKQCGIVLDIPINDSATFKIKEPGELILTECQVFYKGYCKQCKDSFVKNTIFL